MIPAIDWSMFWSDLAANIVAIVLVAVFTGWMVTKKRKKRKE